MRTNRNLSKKSKTIGSDDTTSTINRLDKMQTKMKKANEKIPKQKTNLVSYIWGGSLVSVMMIFLFISIGGNDTPITTDSPTIGNPIDAKILDGLEAHVFKSPTCGCCHLWMDYMKQNTQMIIESTDIDDMTIFKQQNSVPDNLYSCHTVMIGDYIIEGHVPYQAIVKLFQDQPTISGIGVAGMPDGSPGMGGTGPFTVESFDADGNLNDFMNF